MMAEQPKAMGGGDRKSNEYHRASEKPSDPSGNVTLAQAGIGKNLAHRARTAAAMTQEQFEADVEQSRTSARLAIGAAVMPGARLSKAAQPRPDITDIFGDVLFVRGPGRPVSCRFDGMMESGTQAEFNVVRRGPLPAATRAKISASNRKAWADPAKRAAQSVAVKERFADPAMRQLISDRTKEGMARAARAPSTAPDGQTELWMMAMALAWSEADDAAGGELMDAFHSATKDDQLRCLAAAGAWLGLWEMMG
jgi:hypothetical protein